MSKNSHGDTNTDMLRVYKQVQVEISFRLFFPNFFIIIIMSTTFYNHRLSITSENENGSNSLDSAVQYLSAACIAQWVQQRPSAQATLTLDGGDTVNLPVYALRRRNAVVENLPDAPLLGGIAV
jgi:hypothetical protein